MDHPVVAPSFTVPEAAAFLGRSELTFKRWIRDGLLPGPILKDTVRGYRHYSLGELQTVAKVLAVHEKEYAYLLVAHEVTKHKMWQAMQAYRALHV